MNKPRNVRFEEMSRIECLQVLIEGELPDGTEIKQDVRLASLGTLLPIVKYEWLKDVEVSKLLDKGDSFVVQTGKIDDLIKKAEKILKK
jgi:hypothetical protein